MPTDMQLLDAAERVLEVPEETAAGYLPRLLDRLAWVSPRDLSRSAILAAMVEVTSGREPQDQGADSYGVPYSSVLLDQAHDVPEHVPASIASRALFTVLYRASGTPDADLTHDWIVEQTARAVRDYRASDAVNAARGAVSAVPPVGGED